MFKSQLLEPAASTIGGLLKRDGLVVARKQRRKAAAKTDTARVQAIFEAAFRQ